MLLPSLSIGRRCEEFSLASFRVEKAAHRIELAEVKSENLHVLNVLEVWGGTNVTVVVNATQDHGSESPDFIRMAPTPNPGLTWILSSLNVADALCEPFAELPNALCRMADASLQ